MKRIFRMAIILIPVAILLTGIGLWRHHYLKFLKAEPVKVYKSTPLQPNKLPTNANTPKVTSVKSEDNTDVEIEPRVTTQHIDEIITPEETDNTSNPSADVIGDIAEQPNLSPEAATTLKEYEAAQSEYIDVQDVLQAALDARPIDFEKIRSANESIVKAKQKRLDALEKLAVYLNEAFYEFLDTIEQENETDRIIADRIAEGKRGLSPDVIRIMEVFETMSPAERKRVLQAIPQFEETMKSLLDNEIP